MRRLLIYNLLFNALITLYFKVYLFRNKYNRRKKLISIILKILF